MTDGDEQAGHGQIGDLAGVDVTHAQPGHRRLAEDLFDRRVPDELDLLVGEGALLHDRACAQGLAPVNDRDAAGEAGEEGGLLHRRVAAADDRDVLVTEEEAVTGGTGGHAVGEQPVFAGDAEAAPLGTGRDDHRSRVDGALVSCG